MNLDKYLWWHTVYDLLIISQFNLKKYITVVHQVEILKGVIRNSNLFFFF